MSKITIDLSGIGGLAPKFNGDMDRTVATPNLRYIGNDNQMADGIYNPLRRYGYLSPANATMASLTFTGGTHDSNLTTGIYDSVNDDFYIGGADRQIWQGDTLDDTQLQQKIDLGATGTPHIYDLEIYQLNDVRKLFYVYETGGKLEVGTATLPFASANSDWLSTDVANTIDNTLSADSYPFMRVADNGFAYIFESNNIHKLDGTASGGANGTMTANVIQFPAYFQIIDAIDYRGKLYVVIQHTTKVYSNNSLIVFNKRVGVYIWDRFSSIVNMRDYIPVEGVREIQRIYVSPQGDLRIMTASSEAMAQIRSFNGSTFKVIEEIGYHAGIGRHLDSLTNTSNMTMWLGTDGILYAQGKLTHRDKEAVYKIGDTAIVTYSMSTPGVVLFGGANTDSSSGNCKATKNGLFLGYMDSSAAKYAKEWDIYGTGSDGVVAKQAQGDVYSLVKFLPQMSNINHIDLYMFPGSGSGATAIGTLKIYFNQSTTPWASKTITQGDSALGYKRIEINEQYINSVQLEVEYPTASSIGTTDFAPSFCVVDYSPTNTKG